MREFAEMGIAEFMEFEIEALQADRDEQIVEMETVCHSPNELGFLAGRIAELHRQIRNMNQYLQEYREEIYR